MPTQEQEYQELTQRVERLRESRAVLVSREAEKKIKRQLLEQELKAAGVDVEHIDLELARLEKEEAETLAAARTAVETAEREMSEALKGG